MQVPYRALIVEDLPGDAELMVEQLRRDGHMVGWSRVDTERDYRSALNDPPDVILSDCRLPSFSAARALAILRASALDVPLVLVSGTIGEEAAAELMREGAADYVSKDRPGRLGMAVSRAMADVQIRRERATAVAELERAEQRFRGLFESQVIGIIVATQAGRVTEANGYFLSIVGRSTTDLPLDWIDITPEAFIPRDKEALAELKLLGHTSSWEKEFLGDDGHHVPVLMGCVKLPDDCAICYIVDLTQVKTVQADLEVSKAQLEAAITQLRLTQDAVIAKERLHALGQMASGIAHDFNNNLSPIVGLSELILTRPHLIDDHEKVLEYVRTIYQAGQDAALVVSRLKDFYRSASDDTDMQVVGLKQVVEAAIELTRPRWSDQAMVVDVKYQIVLALDDIRIRGHAAELREMLVNLIFNALDAMPDGGKLSVRVKMDAEKPGMASLEVSDTGVGMSEDVRKHCLEPFFTTKGASGTGLGLATSLGIITRHHGAIEIDTYPGRGTRMVITLPMDEVVMASPAPMQVRVAPAMHILVVDDEELARGVVAEFLRIDGHDVEMADGAASALEKVSTDHFDLMITDRAMPERSGDRLAVDVKTLGLDLPIIMLTGFGGFMRTMGEMPDGVDLVIGKPITLAALREAMAEVTSRGR